MTGESTDLSSYDPAKPVPSQQTPVKIEKKVETKDIKKAETVKEQPKPVAKDQKKLEKKEAIKEQPKTDKKPEVKQEKKAEVKVEKKAEAKIEKKRRAIELDFEAKKTKAEDQRSSDLELLRVCGIKKPNVIYYDHSNTLQANWSNTEKLFTREEWEEFTRQIEASKFPAGLKFKFQDRPKY